MQENIDQFVIISKWSAETHPPLPIQSKLDQYKVLILVDIVSVTICSEMLNL